MVTTCAGVDVNDWPEGSLIEIDGDLDVTDLPADYCLDVCSVRVSGDLLIEGTDRINLDGLGCIDSVRMYALSATEISLMSQVSHFKRFVAILSSKRMASLVRDIWQEEGLEADQQTFVFDNKRGCDLDGDGRDADFDCDDNDPTKWRTGFYQADLNWREMGSFCNSVPI